MVVLLTHVTLPEGDQAFVLVWVGVPDDSAAYRSMTMLTVRIWLILFIISSFILFPISCDFQGVCTNPK